MGKRWVAAILVVALAALLSVPAFAAADNDARSWFETKFAAKKAWVDQAVKSGRLSAEQGEVWKNHFDQMYKFHEQNGFTCPMGGPGPGRGMGAGFGPGYGMGRGGGMWGGWGLNQAPSPAQQ